MATELIVIRHAPALDEGRVAGRRDVAAALPDVTALAGRIGDVDGVLASPARRCIETARALWPGRAIAEDAALWEQDFGDWEDLPRTDLPDLGPLSAGALAAHAPPGGESFAAMCARVAPALDRIGALGGRRAVVAHAGTVRAALALATCSVPGALAFQVAPLSLSRFLWLGAGQWAVIGVNG